MISLLERPGLASTPQVIAIFLTSFIFILAFPPSMQNLFSFSPTHSPNDVFEWFSAEIWSGEIEDISSTPDRTVLRRMTFGLILFSSMSGRFRNIHLAFSLVNPDWRPCRGRQGLEPCTETFPLSTDCSPLQRSSRICFRYPGRARCSGEHALPKFDLQYSPRELSAVRPFGLLPHFVFHPLPLIKNKRSIHIAGPSYGY